MKNMFFFRSLSHFNKLTAKKLLLTIIENLNFYHMQNHYSGLRSEQTNYFGEKKNLSPSSIYRQTSNLRLV
jgi:hypothetical protein